MLPFRQINSAGNTLTQSHRLHSACLGLLVVLVLPLGLFFRFTNLDRKFYSHDEAFSSLRTSGYSAVEVIEQIFDGHEIGIKELQKYQRPNPEKGLVDTIASLATEEPHQPPLYFLLARFWMQLWMQWSGNPVAVMRSLTALISLFAIPCLYWLCAELFQSRMTGLIAVALISVSPFHVLYAQDARTYALWTVTILLSSAALLRAIRLNTARSWGVYAVAAALGFYSHLLFGLVAIGHGFYTMAMQRFRLTKVFVAYGIASLIALLAFTPWILTVIINFRVILASTPLASVGIDVLGLVPRWIINFSSPFFDLAFASPIIMTYVIRVLVLILVGYSVHFLCKESPKRIWLFVLSLIGVPAVALMLPDVILGGSRSVSAQYLLACYLGIQLAVAHHVAGRLTSDFWGRTLGLAVALVLITGGVVSCVISSRADSWWNKVRGVTNPGVAHAINQASHPLLIVGYPWPNNLGDVFALSYLLDPKVRLKLAVNPNAINIPDDCRNVFLLDSSYSLWEKIEKEKHFKLEDIFPGILWRVVPRNRGINWDDCSRAAREKTSPSSM